MAAGTPFRSDNGNLILDTSFGAVDAALGAAVHAIPGVIEHGLFLGMARGAIIGCATGVRILGELA
jgi:ribose 5-phosphate isomerase A